MEQLDFPSSSSLCSDSDSILRESNRIQWFDHVDVFLFFSVLLHPILHVPDLYERFFSIDLCSTSCSGPFCLYATHNSTNQYFSLLLVDGVGFPLCVLFMVVFYCVFYYFMFLYNDRISFYSFSIHF